MKILQVCPKPPFPPIDGGCVAMYELGLGLLDQGHHLHTLALRTPRHAGVQQEASSGSSRAVSETVFLDTTPGVVGALLGAFSKRPYIVSRFDHPRVHRTLERLLEAVPFDVIHLETLFLAPYLSTLRRRSQAPVVLRAHNLEFEIWRELAVNESSALRRRYLSTLARHLKQYELKVSQEIDGIAAITPQIAGFFREHSQVPVIHVPVGLSIPRKFESGNPHPFFLGSMEWGPNREAMTWFLEDIWPDIQARHPDLRFFLAGKGLEKDDPRWKRPGIVVVGQIEDADRFMRSKGPLVVPMRSGSGVSIKVLQAMAMGKTVISTTLGARGLDCEPGRHLLIADTPQSFTDQIHECVSHPQRMADVGGAAREFLASHFSPTDSTSRLLELYGRAGAR